MAPPSEAEDSSPDTLELTAPTARCGTRWSSFFAGDCLLDEGRGESPFGSSLRQRMRNADLSVVNLEGPVAGAGEPSIKTGPTKQSIEETPTVLANAGVDAVTLANNHAMDYESAGLFETMASCRDAGIGFCGAGSDISAALAPHRATVADDIDVALISLCERVLGSADDAEPGTAWIDHPDALRRAETAASEADVVIVFAHGGVEYVPFPSVDLQRRLRSFAAAGADLVVGHHPHVAQGWERVDGVPIFYSLGNFLFDQRRRPSTQRGLALEVTFRGDTPVEIELVPTEFTDGTVREMPESADRRDFLDHLRQLARITADEDALEAHWQEIADRIFLQRYSGWLRESAGGDPMYMALQPDLHLQQGGLWDSNRRQSEMLVLLSLLRNESHRAVMETALELRAGIGTDRRTPEVEERVRELLSRTEDRPVYDPPSATSRRLQALFNRFV